MVVGGGSVELCRGSVEVEERIGNQSSTYNGLGIVVRTMYGHSFLRAGEDEASWEFSSSVLWKAVPLVPSAIAWWLMKMMSTLWLPFSASLSCFSTEIFHAGFLVWSTKRC